MPKLKRPGSPETFDFEKATTLIVSKVKELNRTINDGINQIEYIESQKRQLKQDIERLANEKLEIIKLKDELRDKLIEKKSEFLEFIGTKQRELEQRKADLDKKEAELDAKTTKSNEDIDTAQKELEYRSTELEKEKANMRESLRQELRAEIQTIEERTIELDEQEADNQRDAKSLRESRSALDLQVADLNKSQESLKSKAEQLATIERELGAREEKITKKEIDLAASQNSLSQTAASMETQITMIERERHKVASDRKAIKDMEASLQKRSHDLDAKEIHKADANATRLTHQDL